MEQDIAMLFIICMLFLYIFLVCIFTLISIFILESQSKPLSWFRGYSPESEINKDNLKPPKGGSGAVNFNKNKEE